MNKVEFPIPINITDQKLKDLIKNCTQILPRDRIEIKETINILNKIFSTNLVNLTQNQNIYNLYTRNESKIFFIKFLLRFEYCI